MRWRDFCSRPVPGDGVACESFTAKGCRRPTVNRSSKAIYRNQENAILQGSEIFLSSIVNHELWFGVAKSARPQSNALILWEFVGRGYETLEFSNGDAQAAGQIRAVLKIAGTLIGAYDVLIAAQARRRGAVLVTLNNREFERVPGLMVADWAR